MLKRYNLSGDINIPPEKMEKMIVHDKKRTGTEMNFVFIKGIEKPVVEKIPVRELIGFYKDYLKGIVVIRIHLVFYSECRFLESLMALIQEL